ncbi:MAG TPA: hypothetical protein VL026_04405 [Rhizomicrobium sp.]|nr:hypothetical protein [Rhizomicrobium sp.]
MLIVSVLVFAATFAAAFGAALDAALGAAFADAFAMVAPVGESQKMAEFTAFPRRYDRVAQQKARFKGIIVPLRCDFAGKLPNPVQRMGQQRLISWAQSHLHS